MCSVEDNGIGIPREKLDSVFEMFEQVDPSIERSKGGLGLGLTLVKRLVQMHGGTVGAVSDGEGLGSRFVVRLPVVALPAASPPLLRAAAESARRRRVLIVDDNHDCAASLAMLLNINGHETYTAHDGSEALRAAEQHRPEVVLLDIGLPKLNGYEACRRVRAQPWGKKMKLIAVSGWGQEHDRLRSREAGFDSHVVKPMSHAGLTELLRTGEESESVAAA